MGSSQIICEQRRLQTINRIIGNSNGFFFSFKSHNSEDRTENFVSRYGHVRSNAIKHSRFHEVAGRTDAVSATQKLAALLLGDFYVFEDLFHMRHFNESTQIIGRVKRITCFESKGFLNHKLNKVIVDIFVNDETRV